MCSCSRKSASQLSDTYFAYFWDFLNLMCAADCQSQYARKQQERSGALSLRDRSFEASVISGGGVRTGSMASAYREDLRERSFEAHSGEVVVTSMASRPATSYRLERKSPERIVSEASPVRRSTRVVGLGLHLIRNDQVLNSCVGPS